MDITALLPWGVIFHWAPRFRNRLDVDLNVMSELRHNLELVYHQYDVMLLVLRYVLVDQRSFSFHFKTGQSCLAQ